MFISLKEFAESRAKEIMSLVEVYFKIMRKSGNPTQILKNSNACLCISDAVVPSNKISKRKFTKKRYKNHARNVKRKSKSADPMLYRRLPTHLWHSKRFHMIQIYELTLPFCATTKLYRPTHRAIQNSINLQPKKTNWKTMPAILKVFIAFTGFKYDPHHERQFLIFRDASDYKTLIGPVLISFTQKNSSYNFRIWCHGLMKHTVLSVLSNIPSSTYPMIDTKMARFRLLGPLSLNMILSLINPRDSSEFAAFLTTFDNLIINYRQIESDTIFYHPIKICNLKKIFGYLCKNIENKSQFMLTPTDIAHICNKNPPFHSSDVLKLHNEDLVKNDGTRACVDMIPAQLDMFDYQGFCVKNSDNIDNILESEDYTPVGFVIRNKSVAHAQSIGPLGYGDGIDIILNKKYTAKIFNFLVMHGARVGGLREYHSVGLDTFCRLYPEDFPDHMDMRGFATQPLNISRFFFVDFSRKILKRIKSLENYYENSRITLENFTNQDKKIFNIVDSLDSFVEYDENTLIFVGFVCVEGGVPKKLDPIYVNDDGFRMVGYASDGDMSLNLGKGVGKGVILIKEWTNLTSKTEKPIVYFKGHNEKYHKCDVFLCNGVRI